MPKSHKLVYALYVSCLDRYGDQSQISTGLASRKCTDIYFFPFLFLWIKNITTPF